MNDSPEFLYPEEQREMGGLVEQYMSKKAEYVQAIHAVGREAEADKMQQELNQLLDRIHKVDPNFEGKTDAV